MDSQKINIAGGLDIEMPKMHRVTQTFESHELDDVAAAVSAEVRSPAIQATVRSGETIAVGVGSRGVANIEPAVKALISELKAIGAKPFIFPAMGSHGGATAEGQIGVLANYGITEENVGAPIRATMETVVVTHMEDGTPLYMDKYAHEADGVVLVNRIKPHSTFRGRIESGIIKMLIIGMGKIDGASNMHVEHGMERFPEVLPAAAAALLPHISFRFGLGMMEDAYDKTGKIEALTTETLLTREEELLEIAKSWMPRLYFDEIDVVVLEQMGKEISGAGFDPNIVGRNCRGVTGFGKPHVEKIVVLDLSEQTHGNATGIGLADVITQKLFDGIDFPITYANVIASAYLDGGLIPIPMPDEDAAIALAVKTVPAVKPKDCRIVRMLDTLHVGEIQVSDSLLPLVDAHPQMQRTGG